MEVICKKLPNGTLAPETEGDAELLRSIKSGVATRVKITRIRNYRFHRKLFALIAFLFDIWESGVEPMKYRGMDVLPNIEKFRRDLVILSGRYVATYNVRGEVQLEAKSISFASMSEDEFERLFSDILDIALAKVINRPDLTAEKVREYCEQVMAYD